MARAQGMYKTSKAYQKKQEVLRKARVADRQKVTEQQALKQIEKELLAQPGVEGVERSDVGYWYGVDYTGQRIDKPRGAGYTASYRKRSEVDPLYKVDVEESLRRFYAGDINYFQPTKATKDERQYIPDFYGSGTGSLTRTYAYQQQQDQKVAAVAQQKQETQYKKEVEKTFAESLSGTTNPYTKESLAYQQEKVRKAGYSQQSIDEYNAEMQRWQKNEASKQIQRDYNYRQELQRAEKGLIQPSSIKGESATEKATREYLKRMNEEVVSAKFSEAAVNKYNKEIDRMNRNIAAKQVQAEWNVLQPYIGSKDVFYRREGEKLKPVSLGEVQESLDKPHYAFTPAQAKTIERGDYKIDAAGGVTTFTYQQVTDKSGDSKSQKTKADDWLTVNAARAGDFVSDWGRVLAVPRERQIKGAYETHPLLGGALEFYTGGMETIVETPRIVGYGLLGAEQIARGTIAYNVEFQKKAAKGAVFYVPPEVKGVGLYTAAAGVGLVKSFKEKPIRTSGGIVGGIVIGKTVGAISKVGTKTWGLAKTVGKEYIPIESIGYEPKYGYPISTDITPASIIKSFEKGTLEPKPQYMRSPTGKVKVPYVPKDTHLPSEVTGEKYMYTAWERPIGADRLFGKTATLGEGSSEMMGMYGSPDITTYFTKYGGPSESSIGVDLSLIKRPGIIRTRLKGIETAPKSLTEYTQAQKAAGVKSRVAYEKMQEFADTRKPGTSTSPLTKMEYETILPVGNIVEITGVKYYTKLGGIGKNRLFGTRVPITQVTATGEKVGGMTSRKAPAVELEYESYKPRPKYNVPDYATSYGLTSSKLVKKGSSVAPRSYSGASSIGLGKRSGISEAIKQYSGMQGVSKYTNINKYSDVSYLTTISPAKSYSPTTSKYKPTRSYERELTSKTGESSYDTYYGYDYTQKTPFSGVYPRQVPKRKQPVFSDTGRKKKPSKRKPKQSGFTWKIENPTPTFKSVGFVKPKRKKNKMPKKLGGITI